MNRTDSRLLPAMIKYWRRTRGLSQLDLATQAQISSRHLSFLETGRAKPSRGMVLRLGAVLSIPMRDQNIMLDASGHEPAFVEPRQEEGLPLEVQRAVDRMCAQQEPFPLLLLNRNYDILRLNNAAESILPRLIAQPTALERPVNLLRLLFDHRLVRPAMLEWELVAQTMLTRLYRDALARPGDGATQAFIEELLGYPDVPEAWREPDLGTSCEAACTLRFRIGDIKLSFLATMTLFSAPQNVAVEDLIVESYFPIDSETADACARISGAASASKSQP